MLFIAVVVDEYVVVTAGRWICYINRLWDFKIDMSRMARCISCKNVTSVRQLEESVAKVLYGVCRLGIWVELSYWFDDMLVRVQGKEISACIISSDGGLRSFFLLREGDKSLNLFVTFRESVGGELMMLNESLPKVNKKWLGEKVKVSTVVICERHCTESVPTSAVASIEGPEDYGVEQRTVWEVGSTSNAEGTNIGAGGSSFEADDPWWVDDDALIAHMEAMEAGLLEDVVEADGDGKIVAESEVGEDDEDDDCEEVEEESDYDYDFWTEYVLNESCSMDGSFDDDDEKGGLGHSGCKKKASVPNNERELKKGITVTETYGYDDVSPMFRDPDSGGSSMQCIYLKNEDDLMYVGKVFITREELKIGLSIYAINRVFRFKITKFHKYYLLASCIDKKCAWRVYAH